MPALEKTVFIENLKKLSRRRQIPLGTLEKNIGEYPGYLSRLTKEDTKRLSAETLYRASKIFNCSMEDLIEKECN